MPLRHVAWHNFRRFIVLNGCVFNLLCPEALLVYVEINFLDKFASVHCIVVPEICTLTEKWKQQIKNPSRFSQKSINQSI